ncbi:OmpA family protein [Octadecabacter sp. 1_MG-2023]|uniref:OmpA family protein n=1 Tax=unclassified Octadecabacter TaxID=196158 RepID=UPI001C090BF5|nr:OmpA family protein [Octadecabacter sp. 1_MG-2023]MBU2994401.1 OmpA family protein [Octadecabacter sp. B2R22]MDO6734308.1 OmpA family protein [Octadecabacter sp. 1_MG-2023]
MRKLLGGAVIVAGVVGTGWYGSANNAKTMQGEITDAAAGAAQGTIHPIETQVSGRDIMVSGIANSDAEREEILASMNELDGRRVVRDDLRVLETASPFLFNAAKDADGTTHSGMTPTEADRAIFAERIGADADTLDLMAGAPVGDWTGVVDQGLNSLDALQGGTLTVSDNVITVTGDALTPENDMAARSALADLPDGFEANFDINVLDDGTPLRLTLDLGEDGSVSSTGKIPSTLEVADLSASLGSDVGDGIAQSALAPALADWAEASKTGAAALGELESGQMQMIEDTLAITGVATPDGKAAAEAMLAAMPEGFTATSDIALYDDGEPFTLEMTSDDAGMTARGKFPADLAASDIIGDVPAGDIRNAFIGDDTGFANVAASGVEALGLLEEGTLSIVGTDVSLKGVARTPTEADAATALFGDLPDGYTKAFDITSIDDGTPPNFNVVYMAAEGATVSGKLPADTEIADLTAALDVDAVSGDAVQGLVGEGAQATERLAAVSNWLPELETLTFNSNDAAISVDAVASPGVDVDLIQAGLAEAAGSDAAVTVSAATDLPDDGTTRTNQATGRVETLTNGFWLPVFDFVSDADSCNAQSADALQANRINFVTGSAQLDAQSVRAINSVASIVRKCLSDTDLNVEIGGHTDSQGGEDLNLQLSQERANSVRTALIARGAADAEIVALGYGEAEPIADNETAEGRAENRRTTIRWFTPVVEEIEEPATETPQDDGATDDAANTDTNTEVGE